MRIIEQSATILDWSGLDLYQRVETAARVCRRSESKGDAEEFVRSLIKRGHLSPLEFARVKTGSVVYKKNKFIGPAATNMRRLRENADSWDSWESLFLRRFKTQYPAFVEDLEYVADERGFVPKVEPANDWIPVLFVTSRTISHQLVRYRHDITFCQESQRHVRYDKTGLEVIEPPGLEQLTWNTWNFAMQDAEGAYVEMMEHGATAEQARAVLPGCTATRILAYASPDEWRHIFSQRCDRHADPQMSALMIPLRDEMRSRGMV